MDLKREFARASALIKQGEYIKARRILINIDHPKATEWVRKIDQILVRERLKSTTPKGSTSTTPIIGILILVGVIVGLAVVVGNNLISENLAEVGIGSCEEQTRTWWEDEAEPLVVRYLDTAETAVSTSRSSLSPIVLELQQIHRELQAAEPPECAKDIHFQLDRGMTNANDGFNQFLGGSDSPFWFSPATQNFYDAYDTLLAMGIPSDTRMSDTSVFIWGGGSPSE